MYLYLIPVFDVFDQIYFNYNFSTRLTTGHKKVNIMFKSVYLQYHFAKLVFNIWHLWHAIFAYIPIFCFNIAL